MLEVTAALLSIQGVVVVVVVLGGQMIPLPPAAQHQVVTQELQLLAEGERLVSGVEQVPLEPPVTGTKQGRVVAAAAILPVLGPVSEGLVGQGEPLVEAVEAVEAALAMALVVLAEPGAVAKFE